MTANKKIMLVEDEEDIRSIAKISLEKIGHYSVKYCASGKEALEIVEDFKPDLIILDRLMPEMDGIETLKALKKIPEASKIPVVFMTAKVEEEDMALYKSLNVTDVIKKPFNPRELSENIRKIMETNKASLSDNAFEDEFKTLCNNYSKNLPSKIEEIKNQFKKLTQEWKPGTYIQLSILAHKLAGSAGIYGYIPISEKAGQIEHILSGFDYDIPADPSTMKEIEKLITEMDTLVSNSKTSITPSAHSLKNVDANLIYFLIDTDQFDNAWQKNISQQAMIHGYEIMSFNDIKSLFQAIDLRMPVAILVNYDYLTNLNLNDSDLFNFINVYFKQIHTIFIAKSGSFEERLNAVRMGCRSYYITPFNPDELLIELDNLKYLFKTPFKAIIVDDDKEILNFYSNLLLKANIENKTLTDPKEIENQIHHFQPDIILLDLNMPDCNGSELAAIIRQNIAYEDIPIVFLSTEENRNIQLKAMSVGVDDFITKSSDPNILIQTLRNKANRYKKIKSILARDNLTGAFNYRYMTREIEKQVELSKNIATKFLIAVIEIDNLERIKSLHGHSASDQVLVSLHILLKNHLDPSCVIGHLSHDKIIVLFKNPSIDMAKEELNQIKEKFRGTLQYADGKSYSSTINVGFAVYQNGYTVENLIKLAASDLAHDVNKTNLNIFNSK